jgi:LysM repeat protein
MRSLFSLVIIGLLVGIMTACSTPSKEVIQTQPVMALTPWQTATRTPSPTATKENLPTVTSIPTLTPTPSEYTVRENDTLIVIAYRNGLTVDELLAANPEINPYTMSIGTVLKIPAAKPAAGTQLAPTATPEPLTIGKPVCYPALTGGYHCFALAENDGKNALENVTAEFKLLDETGTEIENRTSLLPLESIQPGERLPLYVYFSSPLPEEWQIAVQLLSAYRAASTGSNTFRLKIANPEIALSADGLSASVSGKAASAKNDPVARSIHIAIVAFDSEGNVVGIRRYEENSALQSGTNFKFNLSVYAAGSSISSVEVYAEAVE